MKLITSSILNFQVVNILLAGFYFIVFARRCLKMFFKSKTQNFGSSSFLPIDANYYIFTSNGFIVPMSS